MTFIIQVTTDELKCVCVSNSVGVIFVITRFFFQSSTTLFICHERSPFPEGLFILYKRKPHTPTVDL